MNMHGEEPNVPPAGHITISEIKGLTQGDRDFIWEYKFTHGMWVTAGESVILEVSRLVCG